MIGIDALAEHGEGKICATSLGAICEIQVLREPHKIMIPDKIMALDKGVNYSDKLQRSNGILNLLKWRNSYTLAPRKVEQGKELEKSDCFHFSLEEYVDLSDGQRIVLRKGRGWSGWSESYTSSDWMLITGQELTKRVMLVLEPDDYDIWIEWVAEQLNTMGILIEITSLRSVPYVVEFGPKLQHQLQERKPLT